VAAAACMQAAACSFQARTDYIIPIVEAFLVLWRAAEARGGYARCVYALAAAGAGETARFVFATAARHLLSNWTAPCAQAVLAPAAAASAAAARLFSSDLSSLPHDKILLHGLVFHGYHGVLPEVGAREWRWTCHTPGRCTAAIRQ